MGWLTNSRWRRRVEGEGKKWKGWEDSVKTINVMFIHTVNNYDVRGCKVFYQVQTGATADGRSVQYTTTCAAS